MQLDEFEAKLKTVLATPDAERRLALLQFNGLLRRMMMETKLGLLKEPDAPDLKAQQILLSHHSSVIQDELSKVNAAEMKARMQQRQNAPQRGFGRMSNARQPRAPK
jgi:hypothetical protein